MNSNSHSSQDNLRDIISSRIKNKIKGGEVGIIYIHTIEGYIAYCIVELKSDTDTAIDYIKHITMFSNILSSQLISDKYLDITIVEKETAEFLIEYPICVQ